MDLAGRDGAYVAKRRRRTTRTFADPPPKKMRFPTLAFEEMYVRAVGVSAVPF